MTPDYQEVCIMPPYGQPALDRVRVYAAPGQPVLVSLSNVERELTRGELSNLVDALCQAAKVSES